MDTVWRLFAFLAMGCIAAALAARVVLAPPAAAAGAEDAGFDAAHRVTFRSGATPFDKLNFNTPHDRIAGYLYRPEGAGPFPAVVLEPDLAGLRPVQSAWARRLAEWGYVALAVDIRSRGKANASAVVAAHDAYGALRHLAGLPFVDVQRVAWIGWSQQAGQAIVAAGGLDADPKHPDRPMPWLVSEGPWRFREAIAFYPVCPGIGKTYYAPMLMLLAGKDSRRLKDCQATAERSTAGGQPVRFKLYPEATQFFDVPDVRTDQFGERARYDPAAAEDAIAQVKAFLAERLARR